MLGYISPVALGNSQHCAFNKSASLYPKNTAINYNKAFEILIQHCKYSIPKDIAGAAFAFNYQKQQFIMSEKFPITKADTQALDCFNSINNTQFINSDASINDIYYFDFSTITPREMAPENMALLRKALMPHIINKMKKPLKKLKSATQANQPCSALILQVELNTGKLFDHWWINATNTKLTATKKKTSAVTNGMVIFPKKLLKQALPFNQRFLLLKFDL